MMSTVLLASRSGAATAAGRELSFFAVGDWGKLDQSGQLLVAAAMTRCADQSKPDFVVSLGNNFGRNGVTSIDDRLWQTSFENVYNAPSLQCPWYPVLGNLDHRGQAMAQIAYSQRSDRWTFPSPFHAVSSTFDPAVSAHFFFLDTTAIVTEHGGIFRLFPRADEQLSWLQQSLAASDARWKIVIGHHPIYSGGPYGATQALMEHLMPLLIRNGVALYVCGREHNMQFIRRDNMSFAICGSGAQVAPIRQPVDGGVFSSEQLGFVRARVSLRAITVDFINAQSDVSYSAVITQR